MGRFSSGTPSLAYPIGWRGIVIMMVGLGVSLCRHNGCILSASLEKSSRVPAFALRAHQRAPVVSRQSGADRVDCQAVERQLSQCRYSLVASRVQGLFASRICLLLRVGEPGDLLNQWEYT